MITAYYGAVSTKYGSGGIVRITLRVITDGRDDFLLAVAGLISFQ